MKRTLAASLMVLGILSGHSWGATDSTPFDPSSSRTRKGSLDHLMNQMGRSFDEQEKVLRELQRDLFDSSLPCKDSVDQMMEEMDKVFAEHDKKIDELHKNAIELRESLESMGKTITTLNTIPSAHRQKKRKREILPIQVQKKMARTIEKQKKIIWQMEFEKKETMKKEAERKEKEKKRECCFFFFW